jgi:hypothetical protein
LISFRSHPFFLTQNEPISRINRAECFFFDDDDEKVLEKCSPLYLIRFYFNALP